MKNYYIVFVVMALLLLGAFKGSRHSTRELFSITLKTNQGQITQSQVVEIWWRYLPSPFNIELHVKGRALSFDLGRYGYCACRTLGTICVRRRRGGLAVADHKSEGRRSRGTATPKLSAVSTPRVQHALAVLDAKGILGQGGSRKVSARLDPGLLEAARAKMAWSTTRIC